MAHSRAAQKSFIRNNRVDLKKKVNKLLLEKRGLMREVEEMESKWER